MLIGWFLSIISCNSCSIYHFKKWLQKFVKEKVIKKKHLTSRGPERIAVSNVICNFFRSLWRSLRQQITTGFNIWYLKSCAACIPLLHLCVWIGKKRIEIIEYNLSHEKFVTRVESVFWMSEWKQNPFPTRKTFGWIFPLSKMVHINHPESWIVLSFLVLYEPLVN